MSPGSTRLASSPTGRRPSSRRQCPSLALTSRRACPSSSLPSSKGRVVDEVEDRAYSSKRRCTTIPSKACASKCEKIELQIGGVLVSIPLDALISQSAIIVCVVLLPFHAVAGPIRVAGVGLHHIPANGWHASKTTIQSSLSAVEAGKCLH